MKTHKMFEHNCDSCGAQLWRKAYQSVFNSLEYGFQDEVLFACDCGIEYKIKIDWGISNVKILPLENERETQ